MRLLFLSFSIVLSLALAPVTAAPIVFHANLDGPSESPPNASPGTGFTFVTIDPVAHTMRIEAVFSGLLGLTTAAHIHIVTPPNPTGGVATTVPTFPGFPLGVTGGSYDETFNTLAAGTYNPAFLSNATNMGSTANAENSLFSGIMAGNAYLNIHSTVFGGGEIRGFLAETPEPSTFALAGTVLMGLLAIRRRKSRT